MKSLENPEDKREIVNRLGALGTESRRRWGRMTVAEMLCHVSDAFSVGLGEKQARDRSSWAWRSLVKWIALWGPVEWPHGVPTVPECDAKLGGTPPVEFELDRRRVLDALDRFTQSNRGHALEAHPIFGKLSEKEWMRWGYLHADHHLRQFGA
jgi:hypothetical protein